MSTSIKLPFLIGSQSAFTALETKDPTKFYVLQDAAPGSSTIYLGDIPLAKNGYAGKTIVDVSFDTTDHVFEFTFSDGTTEAIDLPTESVFQSVAYDSTAHVVTFTLVSGSTTSIDLSDLIPVAEEYIYNDEEKDGAIPTIGAVKGLLMSEISADDSDNDWKAVTVGALKAALELGTF